MIRLIQFVFLFLISSFFINAYGQLKQKDVHEAERLMKIFDQKLKNSILDTLFKTNKIFGLKINNQVALDRNIFSKQVFNGGLFENDIDEYIENKLLPVYSEILNNYLEGDSLLNEEANEYFQVETSGSACENVDFELGTTTGWEGWTWFATIDPYPPTSSLFPGLQATKHQIITGAGFDAIVGGSLLPEVAPGGNYSLRLENQSIGGHLSRISQTFLVNPANANFTYRYAVVLEDPTDDHFDIQRPYFKIRVLDQARNEILCGKYEVIAKPPIIGFQRVGSSNYYWRNWTTISIPLLPYVGQNVTVEFTASDCSLGGHLGYAYIDGSCFQSSIISIPSSNCGGLPYTLIAPPGYATYAWTGPGIIGANNLQTISVSQTGTYTCIITSVSGATCTSTLKAVVQGTPTVSAGPDFTICKNEYAQLNANITLSDSFSWSPTTNMSNPNTLNPVVTPTTTTTYHLSSCGIKDSTTVYVENVDFNITPDTTLCETTTLSLNATPLGSDTYSYSWSPTAGMIGANTSNPTVTASSTTTYSVTVTNLDKGCSNTKQVTVNVIPLTNTSVGPDKTYCGLSPIQLNVTGGSNYTWTDINGNVPNGISCTNCSNPMASPSTTTDYIVTSNLPPPCVNKDTITIFVSSPPIVSLGNDTLLCVGETIQLGELNSSYNSFLWSTGHTGPSINVASKGDYWLEITDGFCSKRDSISILAPKLPAPLTNGFVCIGQQILLNVGSNFQSYLWHDGSTDSTINIVISDSIVDSIFVEIVDVYGCIYKDSLFLYGQDCSVEELFIPNLVTANSDKQNDKFHIKGLPKESSLKVYNRWGDLIYKNSNYDNSWSVNDVSDGVYYFMLNLNDEREFKGWLQIIK